MRVPTIAPPPVRRRGPEAKTQVHRVPGLRARCQPAKIPGIKPSAPMRRGCGSRPARRWRCPARAVIREVTSSPAAHKRARCPPADGSRRRRSRLHSCGGARTQAPDAGETKREQQEAEKVWPADQPRCIFASSESVETTSKPRGAWRRSSPARSPGQPAGRSTAGSRGVERLRTRGGAERGHHPTAREAHRQRALGRTACDGRGRRMAGGSAVSEDVAPAA